MQCVVPAVMSPRRLDAVAYLAESIADTRYNQHLLPQLQRVSTVDDAVLTAQLPQGVEAVDGEPGGREAAGEIIEQ